MFDHHNSPLSCKLKRLFRSNNKGHCIYTFDDIMASLVAADLTLLGFTQFIIRLVIFRLFKGWFCGGSILTIYQRTLAHNPAQLRDWFPDTQSLASHTIMSNITGLTILYYSVYEQRQA